MPSTPMHATHYQLVCSVCGHRRLDDGLTLGCAEPHAPGLWKTEYRTDALLPDDSAPGVFRYRQWLPVRRTLFDAGGSAVFRSKHLAESLGLRDLWIAFNGYWPERGGDLMTGSFKELEAATVLGRIPEGADTLVVASAGNTAVAFAELCVLHQVPLVLVVPASALGRLRTRTPRSRLVCVIAVDQGDYTDAIALADALSRLRGFTAEGGTRNVGRRDGLATVLLAATEAMGGLPAYYVQAIGSGAGAIAAHEAAIRLGGGTSQGKRDGKPRLILAQNAAYAPVHQAWHTGRRPWETQSEADQRVAVEDAFAPELTNRRPPYDVVGGLRDALAESAGDVFTADALSARSAMRAFRELEGIDIEPAAGVAVAALREAVRRGRIDLGSPVLLNITGGGRARLAEEHPLSPLQPDLVVARSAFHGTAGISEVAERISAGDLSTLTI